MRIEMLSMGVGAFAGWPLTLAVLLCKVTLIPLAALAMTRVMRRAPASARHVVWLVALSALLLVPVLSALLPLPLRILPHPGSTQELRMERATPAVPDLLVSAPASVPEAGTSVPARPSAAGSTIAAPSRSVLGAASAVSILAALWAVVMLGIAASLGWASLVVRRIVRRARPLDTDGWLAPLWEAADRLDLAEPPRLLRSDEVRMPFACGVRRPTIVLPGECEEWSLDRRRAVLMHELAHIRRRDLLGHLLSRVSCAVYWFHPLVWAAARELRAESERACDDVAVACGTPAPDYAEHLLAIVTAVRGDAVPSVALAMARRKEFEGRILAILDGEARRTPVAVRRSAALLVPFALLTLGIGAARPAARAASETPRPTPAAGLVAVDEAGPAPRLDRSISAVAAGSTAARTAGVSSALLPAPADGTPLAADAGDTGAEGTERARVASSVTALVSAVADEQPAVRVGAIQALGSLRNLNDPRAVQALIEALRTDPDPEVRNAAVWALGQIEDRAAVPALVQAMLEDRAIEVRRTAVWALGQIEDPSAVDALARASRDADAEVRRTAVWALGQIENRRAVPALTAALSHSDVETRRLAAWALGQMEAKEGIPGLVEAMRDADTEVRETAVWALGNIEAAEAVPALATALKDSSARIRSQAAWALGQIESPAGVSALGATVQSDADPGVRQTAAWALGQIEDAAALAPLTAALRDQSPKVRATAAWAIGQTEPGRAPEALVAALRDSSAEVRSNAIWAIGQIGDAEALAELLRDPDASVRAAAARAIGGHPDPRPRPSPQPRPRPRPRPEL